MKIDLRGSALIPGAFADLYATEPGASSSGLVLYIGGAVSEAQYEARRHTVPKEIVSEWTRALESVRQHADLLVLSSPPLLSNDPAVTGAILRGFFEHDLSPRLPFPLPGRIGIVGMSFGAFLGIALAGYPAVATLATLGGVGMREAWLALEHPVPEREIVCFANAADPLSSHTDAFVEALTREGRRVDLVQRPGGHAFADYAENGSVQEAFRRAVGGPLADLADRHHHPG